MELERFDTGFRIATVVALVVGLGAIFVPGTAPALTTVGIVSVIASAVVFMFVVRNFLVQRYA